MTRCASLLVALAMLAFVSPTRAEDPPAFLLKWGTLGTGDGEFNAPTGVAVNALGDVFVADTENQRIQKFTGDGAWILKWTADGHWANFGSPTSYYFPFRPTDIAVDASDNVYVADGWISGRILRFSSNGLLLNLWSVDTPSGIAVDASGSVYVSELYRGRISKFTGTGALVSSWGTRGSEPGQFELPRDVAVGPSGTIYVAEQGNHRIQKFTDTGTFLGGWQFGTHVGEIEEPWSLAVDHSENVFVTDRGQTFTNVQKFTSDGAFLTEWGSIGSGDGQFYWSPPVLAVDLAGNVLAVDPGNNRVQKFGELPTPTRRTTWGRIKAPTDRVARAGALPRRSS